MFIFHFFLGRRIFFHKLIQVWEFPSNFISRYDWIQFIWKTSYFQAFYQSFSKWRKLFNRLFMVGFIEIFSLKWITFSTWCNRPIIHLWTLHRKFFFKMNRFFKMTQAVPPSIYGRFIETFSLEWITFQHDANIPKPFTFWICSWMTGWLKGDWEEHEKCLRVFSTFEFLHFFQMWWSLGKQKYGFLLTRGKIIVFFIIKTWRACITCESIFT